MKTSKHRYFILMLVYTYKILNFFIHLFFRRKIGKKTFKQMIKHYLVGALGAILNYVLFNILYYYGISTVYANTITYFSVFMISFLMQKYFTYRVKTNSTKQFILYIIFNNLIYVIDTAYLVLLIDHLKIIPLISKLIAIVTFAPILFVTHKYIIFRDKKENTSTIN